MAIYNMFDERVDKFNEENETKRLAELFAKSNADDVEWESYSMAEIQKLLSVTAEEALKLINSGLFKTYRAGNEYRASKKSVQENRKIIKAKVYVNDKSIELTALEYRLLLIFASNKGILLTRQQILDKIWDADGNFVEDNTLTVSLNKMEWLVGALLKMAKLDAHAIDFIKNDVHTSELLEAVKPSVAILLDIHNLTIELKQDCIIHCDKRWTTEALTNIVKNAIEYSPDGSVIEIDSGENSMYSWISVRDSGMGMDKTEYAALFKRFENSTNENGFGIGMPLALSILKGQGGDIDVDFGGKGEGTIFILKFFK